MIDRAKPQGRPAKSLFEYTIPELHDEKTHMENLVNMGKAFGAPVNVFEKMIKAIDEQLKERGEK